MSSLLAIILALTIKTDMREPLHLFDDHGKLDNNQQVIALIEPSVIRTNPIKVDVQGDGHGNLDCYLLRWAPRIPGWVVSLRDEGSQDSCAFTYAPTANDRLRLWVINHGKPTNYTITVTQ